MHASYLYLSDILSSFCFGFYFYIFDVYDKIIRSLIMDLNSPAPAYLFVFKMACIYLVFFVNFLEDIDRFWRSHFISSSSGLFEFLVSSNLLSARLFVPGSVSIISSIEFRFVPFSDPPFEECQDRYVPSFFSSTIVVNRTLSLFLGKEG